ncbi:hypothetical protein BDR07DRAFT_1615900, partial [Suillus spraguei]
MFQDQDQNTTPQDTFHAQSPARICSPSHHTVISPSSSKHLDSGCRTLRRSLTFVPPFFRRILRQCCFKGLQKERFYQGIPQSNHPPAPQILAQTLHLPSHSHSSRTSSQRSSFSNPAKLRREKAAVALSDLENVALKTMQTKRWVRNV